MFQRYFLAPLAALLLLAAAPRLTHAQTGNVGIGTTTPDASAALDIKATNKGLLPPRLSTTQRDAIASPAVGLTIYNTSTNALNTWNGTNWGETITSATQPYQVAAVTFGYTGSAQTYTVPAGVISLGVDAQGAQGGNNYNGSQGGLGGRVVTTLAVTPGETLTIYVGGQGGTAPYSGSGGAGYNGGGRGNSFNGGGGGATDLRRSTTVPSTSLTDRLVVAGGGGGTAGTTGTTGGNGGGLSGSAGMGSDSGQGGTQTAGGAGGSTGGPGTLGQGGTGKYTGGGGGYYGGGGGSDGAGGGSGYAAASTTNSATSNTTMTTGYRSGNGSLTLTPGSVYAAPVLSGANFVDVPGDNLGNHTATTNLGLNGNWLSNAAGNANGLRIDNSGNVGIGTTTPSQKLDVSGNANISGLLTAGTASVGGSATVGGSLGVGTSSPAGQLANTASNVVATDGNGISTQGLGWVNASSAGYAGVFFNANNGPGLAVKVTNQGTAALDVSQGSSAGVAGTPLLRVQGGGNVGIGTTTPGQKLDVSGNANVSGSAYVGGNIGIGTSSPSQKLDVNGSAVVRGDANVSGSASVSGDLSVSGNANVARLTTLTAATVTQNMGIGTPAGNPPTSSLLTLQGTSMLLGFRSSSTDRYTFGLSSNGLNLYENSNGYKTRLFFKDGGNIGIGTSNPGHPLTLQANSPGSGGAMLGLYDSGGTDKFNFSLDGGGLNLSESNVAAGRLYVRYGGNVGIGTTTPLARLHVSGSTTLQATGGPASFFNPGGGFNSTGSLSGLKQTVAYFEGGEVWVNGYIVAGSLQTVSDRRLKHVLGLSDRAADLALLQRLRITDYTYIDQVNNPAGVIKKVIAQEVEQVLPTAVSRSTQALPNVYEKATKLSYADGYLTVTTARPHELPARGGRMRFYTPANQSLDPDVTVLDAHTVRFASAEAHAAGLFVYGKYVDDFRSVDYDALTTLTVSATQELARRVEALEKQSATLQARATAAEARAAQATTEASAAKAHAAQTTATLETFEARLRRLEGAAGGQAQR